MRANDQPPSKILLLVESRALGELMTFYASYPLLRLLPKGDGHAVMVLPGLMAPDLSTRPLRRLLGQLGYQAEGWGLGLNRGPTPGLEGRLAARLRSLARRSGGKVSLIGWSLGGVYARQLAKHAPELVRQVITLGSPFSGKPEATNGKVLYEWASGRSAADARFFGRDFATNPPVPSTALFSRTDGVCAWQSCISAEGALAENIEVRGSHCGLGHNPAVVHAIADRLHQEEGAFAPFRPSPWTWWLYPHRS